MSMEAKQRVRYYDWYTFKNDLETRLGRALPVKVWLRTKPTKSLPWCEDDMHATLVETMKILKNEGNVESGYIFSTLR
jgi:hypothetical protein